MKKKIVSVVLASAMAFSLAACSAKTQVEDAVNEVTEEVTAAVEETAQEATEAVEEVKEEVAEAVDEDVTSYADFLAAETESEVTVVTYVQAHQSWWDNKVTVYTQNEDGAYFLYELACSEEDAAKLTEGTKIKVHGFKGEWAGEVEITDGTFEFVEDGDTFVAEAKDVTDKLGTDELADFMNQKVLFTDMTVVSVAFKNDEPGDDIYVTLSKDDAEYSFCLEYYLNGSDEDFYNLVGGLEAGQVVDVEGFLYWYEGANTHITAVTVK